jgi:hypothetical protein
MRPGHRDSPPKRLGVLASSRVAPWQLICPDKALTDFDVPFAKAAAELLR